MSDVPNHEPTGFRAAPQPAHSTAQLAAQAAAGSAVKHLKSVAVVESSGTGVMWEGKVEVFDVLNPPPNRVYAWPVHGGNGAEYVAVLGVYPVDSALAAVRAWLVNEARKKQ